MKLSSVRRKIKKTHAPRSLATYVRRSKNNPHPISSSSNYNIPDDVEEEYFDDDDDEATSVNFLKRLYSNIFT